MQRASSSAVTTSRCEHSLSRVAAGFEANASAFPCKRIHKVFTVMVLQSNTGIYSNSRIINVKCIVRRRTCGDVTKTSTTTTTQICKSTQAIDCHMCVCVCVYECVLLYRTELHCEWGLFIDTSNQQQLLVNRICLNRSGFIRAGVRLHCTHSKHGASETDANRQPILGEYDVGGAGWWRV